MAEVTLNLKGTPKPEAYAELATQLASVLEGIDDRVAEMATVASLVHHAFEHLWTGFYVVVPPGKLLRVGPYQGTLGCLEIPFGKGVCGSAAAEQRTVIVPDVAAYPGHISCDGRSQSEIVVPVFGKNHELIAVFDVDSEHLNTFDRDDECGLERLLSHFQR